MIGRVCVSVGVWRGGMAGEKWGNTEYNKKFNKKHRFVLLLPFIFVFICMSAPLFLSTCLSRSLNICISLPISLSAYKPFYVSICLHTG